MLKICLWILCLGFATTPAFAKGQARKIASVDPTHSEKELKKAGLALAKAYAGTEVPAGATWETSVKKEAGIATVSVRYSVYDKKEEIGMDCPFTVTFKTPDGGNERGNASISAGFCED